MIFQMDLGSKAAAAHIALLHKDLWLSVQIIWKLVFTITHKTLFWVFALLAPLRNQNWLHVTVFPTPEVHHLVRDAFCPLVKTILDINGAP